MALEPGQILGERWRLDALLASPTSVVRWRVTAVDTGEAAELVSPATGSTERQVAFEQMARAMATVEDPAVARVIAVLLLDRRPWLVRPALDERTLHDVRGPLPPEIAAWVGARLAPALLAAGGRAGPALADQDFGIDLNGAPTLAPNGRPPGRVELGTGRGVAPEVFAGGQPDGRAALYALGAVLFRLLTGTAVPAAGSGRSPLRASALRPDLPEAFDTAIAAMLSADPAHRPAGAAALGSLAGPPVDLRAWLHPAPAPAALRLPAAAPPAPRRGIHLFTPLDSGRPEAWLPLADRAGIPIAAVATLANAGLPFVLGTFTDATAARRAAAAWPDATTALAHPTSGWRKLGLVALASVAWLPLALGLLLGGTFGSVLTAIGVSLFVAVALGAWSVRQATTRYRRAEEAITRVAHEIERRAPAGPVGRTWERLRRTRIQVEALQLPASPAADLRSALRDAERRLEGLAEVITRADDAIRHLDPVRLRARAAVGESQSPIRALADYEAVARTRADTVAELDDLHDALDALVAAAGRLATGGGDAESAGTLERPLQDVRRASREAS